MKTELEWFNCGVKKPNKIESNGREVLSRYNIGKKIITIKTSVKYLEEIVMDGMIDWAYVNLPEEKEGIKCYKCGDKNAKSKLILNGEELHICEKCWKLPFDSTKRTKNRDDYVKSRLSEIDALEIEVEYVRKLIEEFKCKKCGTFNLVKGRCGLCLTDSSKETISRSAEFGGKKHFTCGKCSQPSEMNLICDNCSNDGWIWPLKQLPEEGQRVEVNALSRGIFEYSIFNGHNFEDKYGMRIEDVIGWRPLRDGAHNSACGSCKKHPCGCSKKEERNSEQLPKDYIFGNEFGYLVGDTSDEKKYIADENGKFVETERKPDFSKLREGDLIVADYQGNEIVGFYRPFNDKNILIGFFRNGGGGMTEKEKIKKLIRINIDEPKNSVDLCELYKDKLDYSGVLYKSYPFEEI